MSRKIGIGVIGAGYWGPNLIRNFQSLPSCEVRLVCDLDPGRLTAVSEQYPSIQVTSRLEDVLSDPGVQAAVIATPTESHGQIALDCLGADKDVFVEKPLAPSVRIAEEIVELAEKRGLILMVGHLFLYDPVVKRLLEVVQSNRIGPLRYIHGIRTSMGGAARLDTNILWDAVVHDAYLMPAITGRPLQRVLTAGQGYLDPAQEDVIFVTYDFGDGVLGHVYASWYALERVRRMSLIGADAILSYDDLENPALCIYDRGYEMTKERDHAGRPRWHWRDSGKAAVHVRREEPLKLESGHFVQCLLNRVRPETDGLAGLRALRILEASEQSLRLGRWVELVRQPD